MRSTVFQPCMYNTWGSSWGRNTRNTLEGLLDFVLRALRALRPCDPRRCVHDACISDSDCCIHKPLSLSEKAGCRLHWSKQDSAICTNEQEFGQFEQIYKKLFNGESDEIVDMTGCLQPCSLNQYKFTSTIAKVLPKTDPESKGVGQTSLAFWVASSKTWIEEEVLLYPFTSFLAEFGGALGLFLGFSFMTIWHQIRGCCCK